MKNEIVAKFPSSRYAQILSNSSSDVKTISSPNEAYVSLLKEYQSGLYRETLAKTEAALEQYTGEEIIPKMELLHSYLIGKLKGLNEFKKSLNFLALQHPNSEEGKDTEKYLATNIPQLEDLSFKKETTSSWKVIFVTNFPEDAIEKTLSEKVAKFIKERSVETLTMSNDVYLMDKNILVIHGIKNQENAKAIAQVLKEYKDYKVTETPIVIATDNYKVVQIKKNLEDYLSGKDFDLPTKYVAPVVQEAPKQTEVPKPAQVVPGKKGGIMMPPTVDDIAPNKDIQEMIRKEEERLKNQGGKPNQVQEQGQRKP